MFRPAIVRVKKRLAKSAVRVGIRITATVRGFSTVSICTCKGFPSGSEKILVILHSPKLIEVQLQLKLTLLSGVFVCNCEIDISNWCIQMMSSAVWHSRSPGIKTSVANNRLVFVVYWCSNQVHLKLPLLTFKVIRGRILEYSFNKGGMSWFGWANEGFYLIVVSRLRCYHEIFRSSDNCSAHNTLKLIVNPEEYECHLNNMLLVATNNVTEYVDVCRQ